MKILVLMFCFHILGLRTTAGCLCMIPLCWWKSNGLAKALKLTWAVVLQLFTVPEECIRCELVCVFIATHLLPTDSLISRSFMSHFLSLLHPFLPLCLLFFSLSSCSQECIECPYLCPCKHKGEPAAEVEFLCRTQADRLHHTLASRQPTAKRALYLL